LPERSEYRVVPLREGSYYSGTMSESQNPRERSYTSGSGSEIADALADVMKDQAEKAKVRKQAPAPRSRGTSPLKWGLLLALAGLSAYLWLAPPDWLLPSPPEPPPPALQEAGLRMEIALQARSVEAFREARGRLPESLQEAGDPYAEVEYARLDGGRYVLWMEGEVGRVEYDSRASLDEFLGDARRIIMEGGP